MKCAAMLRGINLGKRTLRKEDLIAAADSIGYANARTLLASGNLVFDAGNAKPDRIERSLHDAIEKLYGFKSQAFVRNCDELEKIVAANPFPEVARDRPGQLLVMFHDRDFPAELLDTLTECYKGPERLKATGRELFIDFTEGQGRSELIPVMAKLKFPLGTGRNWNTVTKLAEMLAGD